MLACYILHMRPISEFLWEVARLILYGLAVLVFLMVLILVLRFLEPLGPNGAIIVVVVVFGLVLYAGCLYEENRSLRKKIRELTDPCR